MMPFFDAMCLIYDPVFLAQATVLQHEILRGMREHFDSPDPLIYMRLTIGLCAVVAIFLALKILAYFQRRRSEAAQAQPLALFVRVQAALGVPLLGRWRLWRMARAVSLPNPAALLISPAFFDRAVERYRPSRRRAAHLAAIRERLFGTITAGGFGPPDPADLIFRRFPLQ